MQSTRRMRGLLAAVSVGFAVLAGCGSGGAGGGGDADGVSGDDTGGGVTVADKWDLWSGGTLLRGANIYQRRVYPELDGTEFLGPGSLGPPFTQGDFDALAALGANLVDISHPGLFTEEPPYRLDEDVQNNLDGLLDMVAEADLFAVITFRTGPGRAEFSVCCFEEAGDWYDESYVNDTVWEDQDAQDAWVAMWRHAADRYRDNPTVVGYDLMCEPNANEVASDAEGDPLDSWDPDAFYADHGNTLLDWNQLHPRITEGIREVDADTAILIGGMAYSAVEWLAFVEPTGDARTVYAVHQYEPVVYTHQDPSGAHTYPGSFDADYDEVDDQVNRDWLDELLATVDAFTTAHDVPVAVNEFGIMRWQPGAAEYMDDLIGLFEQRGMNHALWEWAPAWEPIVDIDAFDFRHGPAPENHTDVASNELMDVIVESWQRNTLRPSNVTFESPRSD
ncbi:MAG: cellulase family glycosylhydrolase [Phycisphaerales bacterium]|nr:MAG: cellulase family glycosylhydrolase [Phycisphaerales bacterium]